MPAYVLIAEPDTRIANSFEQFARERQLEPVRTRDGREALRVVGERGPPGVLVINLVLPGVDGFGVLEALRRTISAAEAPALVVSSSMQLRTTAFNQRARFGIVEIAASGMAASSLRAAFDRVFAKTALGRAQASTRQTAEIRALTANTSGTVEEPTERFQRIPKLPPSRDPDRLARIEALGLVDDRAPDPALQQLVEHTARSLGVPIALLSLVLEQRQWFKAYSGLSGPLLAARGTPIDQSFCKHVVDADVAAPLIVPDATRHPLFADNALVREGTVGSYAGAPLVAAEGTVLGTLCILDKGPMTIGQSQIDQLIALSRRVAGELSLRSNARAGARTDGAGAIFGDVPALLDALELGVVLYTDERRVSYANPLLTQWLELEPGELIGWSQESLRHRIAAGAYDPEGTLRRMQTPEGGPYVARDELELARPQRRIVRWVERPVQTSRGLMQLGTFSDVTAESDLRRQYEPPVLFVEDEA